MNPEPAPTFIVKPAAAAIVGATSMPLIGVPRTVRRFAGVVGSGVLLSNPRENAACRFWLSRDFRNCARIRSDGRSCSRLLKTSTESVTPA